MYMGITLSVRLSILLSCKLNIGYNFAFSQYFKLSNYIAFNNIDLMMPNTLGHICRSFASFVNFFYYSDNISEGCSAEHTAR